MQTICSRTLRLVDVKQLRISHIILSYEELQSYSCRKFSKLGRRETIVKKNWSFFPLVGPSLPMLGCGTFRQSLPNICVTIEYLYIKSNVQHFPAIYWKNTLLLYTNCLLQLRIIATTVRTYITLLYRWFPLTGFICTHPRKHEYMGQIANYSNPAATAFTQSFTDENPFWNIFYLIAALC